MSLTTTLFLGVRLDQNTQFYFDPEIAGGRGFSNVTGIANFPNGEMPRIAAATYTPYIARLYEVASYVGLMLICKHLERILRHAVCVADQAADAAPAERGAEA